MFHDWLVDFCEAECSFTTNVNTGKAEFSITQTGNRLQMEAIPIYLGGNIKVDKRGKRPNAVVYLGSVEGIQTVIDLFT
jgi:hypothetical protein